MVLFPDGLVTPCCLLGNYSLGNIQRQTLEELWNGEAARALRKEFIEGRIKTCAYDIRNRGCDRWFDHLKEKLDVSEIQRGPVLKLDVRLNGKCNLECVMCGTWKEPNGVYDRAGFWEKAEQDLFPHILELDVLGGEPFIQSDTYRLIEAVSKVNPRCRWAFTTNGHWRFSGRIRQGLDRLSIRSITLSIDSLDSKTYSRIRAKGELPRVLRTVEELKSYRDERESTNPFELRMQMVVQQLNCGGTRQFIEFARERGIHPWLSFCYEPFETSILSLEEAKRRRILADFEKEYEETSEETLLNVVQPLRESFKHGTRLDWYVRQLRRQGYT